jgi:hypothetical protein
MASVYVWYMCKYNSPLYQTVGVWVTKAVTISPRPVYNVYKRYIISHINIYYYCTFNAVIFLLLLLFFFLSPRGRANNDNIIYHLLCTTCSPTKTWNERLVFVDAVLRCTRVRRIRSWQFLDRVVWVTLAIMYVVGY